MTNLELNGRLLVTTELPESGLIESLNQYGSDNGIGSFGDIVETELNRAKTTHIPAVQLLNTLYKLWNNANQISADLDGNNSEITDYIPQLAGQLEVDIEGITFDTAKIFLSTTNNVLNPKYWKGNPVTIFDDWINAYEDFFEFTIPAFEHDLLSFNPSDMSLNFNKKLTSLAHQCESNSGLLQSMFSYVINSYEDVAVVALETPNPNLARYIVKTMEEVYSQFLISARAALRYPDGDLALPPRITYDKWRRMPDLRAAVGTLQQ